MVRSCIKRVAVLECIQYDGGNSSEIIEFAKGDAYLRNGILTVKTPEGSVECSKTSWVVRGIKGEHYPVRNDIFKETFDLVPI